MRFVEDKHALQVGGIGIEFHTLGVFCKSLDVDHSDFCLSFSTMLSLVLSELFHQFFARVGGVHHQSSGFKLLGGLF